jgi:hypothetical protein
MNRRHFLGVVSAAAGAAQEKSEGCVRSALLGTLHGHAAPKLRIMLASPDYEVVCVCEPDPRVRGVFIGQNA